MLPERTSAAGPDYFDTNIKAVHQTDITVHVRPSLQPTGQKACKLIELSAPPSPSPIPNTAPRKIWRNNRLAHSQEAHRLKYSPQKHGFSDAERDYMCSTFYQDFSTVRLLPQSTHYGSLIIEALKPCVLSWYVCSIHRIDVIPKYTHRHTIWFKTIHNLIVLLLLAVQWHKMLFELCDSTMHTYNDVKQINEFKVFVFLLIKQSWEIFQWSYQRRGRGSHVPAVWGLHGFWLITLHRYHQFC